MENQYAIGIASYAIIEEGDVSVVELHASGDFYELSRPALDGLRLLSEGVAPRDVEMRLRSKYPEERIDISEFLQELRAMGFIVRKVEQDARAAHEEEEDQHGRLVKPGIGRYLFHPRVIPLYGLLAAANVVLLVLRPSLFPSYRDLLPFSSMLANTFSIFAVSLLLLVLHESGHAGAARAFGIPASIRFGHRLFLVVMETEMKHIWRLPRYQRNIACLAGLCVDHLLLFTALLTLVLAPALPFVIQGLLGIAVFQWVVMTAFQFMIFMKTDLYYVLSNTTGAYNLMEDATAWWLDKLPWRRKRAKVGSPQSVSSRTGVIRAYAFLYIVGLALGAAVFVFYFVPQMVVLLRTSIGRLVGAASAAYKLDAVVTLLQLAVIGVLLVRSWARTYKHGQ